MLKLIAAFIIIALESLSLSPARAASTLCVAHPTSNTLFALPASLVPAAVKAFDLHDVTPQDVQHLTVARCMGGQVYGCFVGANLPCEKADISTVQPAIAAWCKTNPNADFVPAAVSGHETIYEWQCKNAEETIIPPSAPLDARGFFKAYWQQLRP